MEATTVKKNNHGANARRWREWRGVKQDTLAEQIGVSQATLSAYEKKDKLEPEVIEKIAQALDIPEEAITELGEATSINIFSGTWQDNAYATNYTADYQHFNPLEKVVELYERLLKAEQEKVAMLQEVLKGKK
ncbi:helix-turn-helix domain-containing protein [Parabacteroides goldsteinii]|uniref:helix-turn-helix domain-containing protein n=1 Tax=Parabacteroides goldsteinii TaxID=328812 RepID=UPI0022E5E60A|nr:helix-turn-helix transcriptional regulator [Parabacteroides goldsteinii]